MINKQSFSNISKLMKRAHRGLSDPQLMHPDREWAIGLLIAVVLFTAGVVWSSQIYLQYRDSSANPVAPVVENVQVYRESLVNTALSDFSNRQSAHETFLKKVIIEDVIPQEETEKNEVDSAEMEVDNAHGQATSTTEEEDATTTLSSVE